MPVPLLVGKDEQLARSLFAAVAEFRRRDDLEPEDDDHWAEVEEDYYNDQR